MNSQDIILYTIFTVAILCAMWLIINVMWIGILTFYYYIVDEISFYQGKRKR